MRKKYRIVSQFRFTVFLIMIFTVFAFAISTIYGLNTVEGIGEKYTKQLKEITVKEGDTIWSIASDFKRSGCDTRKTVFEICALNNMKAGEIVPGQNIKIPYYVALKSNEL